MPKIHHGRNLECWSNLSPLTLNFVHNSAFIREEPFMIWGGGLGKSGEKKLNGYSRRKKVQQLVAEVVSENS